MTTLVVTVDGKTHELNLDRLTFAEGRAIERVTGESIADIVSMTKPSLTTIQALTWVAVKRTEPELKFSDLDDRAIGDFDFENREGEEVPADPTAPSAEG